MDLLETISREFFNFPKFRGQINRVFSLRKQLVLYINWAESINSFGLMRDAYGILTLYWFRLSFAATV